MRRIVAHDGITRLGVAAGKAVDGLMTAGFGVAATVWDDFEGVTAIPTLNTGAAAITSGSAARAADILASTRCRTDALARPVISTTESASVSRTLALRRTESSGEPLRARTASGIVMIASFERRVPSALAQFEPAGI